MHTIRPFNGSVAVDCKARFPAISSVGYTPCRDQSRCAPSQWETSLHCNDVSHWLSAYLDCSLLPLKDYSPNNDSIRVCHHGLCPVFCFHCTLDELRTNEFWRGWTLPAGVSMETNPQGNICWHWHIEAETKWPPISWRHFQMHFVEWNYGNFD